MISQILLQDLSWLSTEQQNRCIRTCTHRDVAADKIFKRSPTQIWSWGNLICSPELSSCCQVCYACRLLAAVSLQVCRSSVLCGPNSSPGRLHVPRDPAAPQPSSSCWAPRPCCSSSWGGCGGSGRPGCTGRTWSWPTGPNQLHGTAQTEGCLRTTFSFIVSVQSRWERLQVTRSHPQSLSEFNSSSELNKLISPVLILLLRSVCIILSLSLFAFVCHLLHLCPESRPVTVDIRFPWSW